MLPKPNTFRLSHCFWSKSVTCDAICQIPFAQFKYQLISIPLNQHWWESWTLSVGVGMGMGWGAGGCYNIYSLCEWWVGSAVVWPPIPPFLKAQNDQLSIIDTNLRIFSFKITPAFFKGLWLKSSFLGFLFGRFFLEGSLGATGRWLQLKPSSSWPRQRKRSKIVCVLYHSYNPHNPPEMHLDFRLSFQEKYGLDNGCTILIFSTKDGCTHWWWWLHQFRQVIFDTHSRSPAYKYAYSLGCTIVVKCDTCKILGLMLNSTV